MWTNDPENLKKNTEFNGSETCTCLYKQATFKKKIVSGPAAGCVYYCRIGIILGQNFIIFLQKKKKKKKGGGGVGGDFAAARLATISATRWTGNKLFFKGGLTFQSLGHVRV